MSLLSDKQWEHVQMTARLIDYAKSLGWKLTWGDAYRDPRAPYGADKSLHKQLLAVDFNLHINGEWIKDGDGIHYNYWNTLGTYWESLGGAWGGRFKAGPNAGDYNHFSLEHEGLR